MSELARKCPECGAELAADSPESLCPHCLIQLGFEPEADSAPNAAPARDTPPAPDAPPALAVSETVITWLPSLTKVRYFGDYELLSEIAHGGMGVVFKARQVSLKRMVALKMILSGSFASKDFVQRFYTEAEAAARLDHPNIVPIYEIGQHEGQHYFSMKLVEGFSLAQRISNGEFRMTNEKGERTRPKFDIRQSALVISKVARAVHYSHQRGILHRDLKPGNILLDAKGEPQVTDFGLAKITESDTSVTQTNAVMGSPAYMSPEQASGQTKNLTTAADVYSLGAVFYELLTGRPPFQGESALEIMQQVVGREPIPPSKSQIGNRKSQIDEDLETICLKCLEKDPTHRYGSAEALADDLERWLRSEPTLARPSTAWERTRKWAKRNPKIAALASALLVVTVVGFADSLWLWRRAARNAVKEAQQRQRAEASDRASRRNLYASDMKLVEQAWESGDTRLALRLLENQKPSAGQDDLRGFEWRYFWQLCQGEQAYVFRQFTNLTAELAISPNGRTLVIPDHALHIVDLASRKELYTLTNHAGGLRAIAFSPTGDLFISAGADDTIKFWDTGSWREVGPAVRQKGVIAITFSPDGNTFAAGTDEGGRGSFQLWNVVTRERAGDPVRTPTEVTGLSFARSGRTLVVASFLTVQLWDVASRRFTRTIAKQTIGAQVVACASDGRWLAIAGDETTRLYDFSTDTLVTLPTERPKMDGHVAFSPDGSTLALGSVDTTIELWSVRNLKRTRVLKGHTQPVGSVLFSPDGASLVSASSDGSIRIWDLTPKPPENVLTAHTARVWSIALSRDGRTLASGSWDGTVKLWDAETWTSTGTLTTFSNQVLCVTFSPDGGTVAAGSGQFASDKPGEVKVWDRASLREIRTLADHRGTVYWVSFSPDGKWLVSTGGTDETIRIRDAATWETRAILQLPKVAAWQVAFSPDGKLLAVTSDDNNEVKLWNLTTFKFAGKLVGHQNLPVGVWFSHDGRFLASSSWDATVRLWDVASQKQIVALEGHKARVKTVVFSPDDKTIASGSHDGTIKLWSLAARREVATLNSGTAGVNSVIFSRDGKTLYAGCADGSIRRWHAPSFEEIAAKEKEEKR